MRYLDEHKAHEQYDEMLDECYGEVKLGGLTFSPSRVLKEIKKLILIDFILMI